MWLEQCLQLPYRKAFREAGIDGQRLIELTEEQLGELGVTESSHLLRLLSHIAVFRSQLGRTILVSEEPPDYGASQLGADNGSWRLRPVQAHAGASCDQNSGASLDRRKGTPQKSAGRPGATTPRQRGHEATPRRGARAKSTPGLNPVLQTSGSSLASGQRVAEKASQQRTPRVRPGLSAAQGAAQGQRRTRSAEGYGQHQAFPSAVITPRSYRDAWPPMSSPPATSSTWSPDPASLSIPAFAGEASAAETGRDASLEAGGYDLGGTSELIRGNGNCETPAPATRTRSAPHLLHSGQSQPTHRTSPESRLSLKQELSTTSKGCPVVNSEFGKDHSRGATFGTAGGTRPCMKPASKPEQGPEYYETPRRLYRGAMITKGVPTFGRESRRTLECMFTRGQDGPGAGRYEPPPVKSIRGGSWGTSSRFLRRSTDSMKQDKSPGPYSYSPQHHYMSNFK